MVLVTFNLRTTYLFNDEILRTRIHNVVKEILIATAVTNDIDLTTLQFLERNEKISAEFILQTIKEEISEKFPRENKNHLDSMRAVTKKVLEITKNEMDQLDGYCHAHVKHIVYLQNCLIDIQCQEDRHNGRQTGMTSLKKSLQNQLVIEFSECKT